MAAKTPMVVVLTDGEEIHGWIEWYDKACLKVNREQGPNLLIPKASIKYLYKAVGGRPADESEREPVRRAARAAVVKAGWPDSEASLELDPDERGFLPRPRPTAPPGRSSAGSSSRAAATRCRCT